MAQGKYAKPRKNQNSNLGLVIALLILVLLLLVMVVILLRSGIFRGPVTPQPVQTVTQTEPSETMPTELTLAPTPTTAETTVETTQPTEETTEATEETTEATEETTAPTETTPPPSNKGEAVAALARAQIGKPYLFGGNGPEAFDTTGFIYYCFRQNGISAPRRLSDQANYGVEVALEDLQPGDVMFFWTSNPGEVEYPAIYVGNGMIVAARNEEHPVTEMNSNSNYYAQRFVTARRYY